VFDRYEIGRNEKRENENNQNFLSFHCLLALKKGRKRIDPSIWSILLIGEKETSVIKRLIYSYL